MKYITYLLLICIMSANVDAQTKNDSVVRLVFDSGSYVDNAKRNLDTMYIFSKTYVMEVNWNDSAKSYYKKYLSLKRKGFSDSNNKYYLLLNKLKK